MKPSPCVPTPMRCARLILAVGAALSLVACGGGATLAPDPKPKPDTTIPPATTKVDTVFRDEFDGPAGATFDHAKWGADVGTGGNGWGNHELEFYTTDTSNVALDGQGHLVITARAEPQTTTNQCWYGRCRYTSTRLKTQGKFSQMFGRFEARIKIPRGQGVWPAFWMLGADIDQVGWPTCGEIDVMENIGKEPAIVHGTVHGPGYSGGKGIGRAFTIQAGNYADDFHVYAVEWKPGDIRWFVDGTEYFHLTSNDIPSGTTWAFAHPFFILMNFAVGGDWPGSPDSTTTFPQQMVVDYVRVIRTS
ncbi:MAG TPA: glycoside hydrolase family 16 protein [Longimicrobiales bacterium]